VSAPVRPVPTGQPVGSVVSAGASLVADGTALVVDGARDRGAAVVVSSALVDSAAVVGVRLRPAVGVPDGLGGLEAALLLGGVGTLVELAGADVSTGVDDGAGTGVVGGGTTSDAGTRRV
jgi:hypothetical protein